MTNHTIVGVQHTKWPFKRCMMSKQKKEVSQVADMGSLELSEEIIRQRAYELFEQRGCEPGLDLDDWLQAEAEVVGKKPSTDADQSTTPHEVVAA